MVLSVPELALYGILLYGTLVAIGAVRDRLVWRSAMDASFAGIDPPVRVSGSDAIFVDNVGVIGDRWVISTEAIRTLSEDELHTLQRASERIPAKLSPHIEKLSIALALPVILGMSEYYSFSLLELLVVSSLYFFVVAPIVIRTKTYVVDRLVSDRGIDLFHVYEKLSDRNADRNVVQKIYRPSFNKRTSNLKK